MGSASQGPQGLVPASPRVRVSAVGYAVARYCMGRAEDFQLLKDFAAAYGVALRTARNYRRDPATGKPRPEWVDFLSTRGLGKATATTTATEANDLERARLATENAYATLTRLQSMQAATSDPVAIAALQKAVADALRAWHRARDYAEDLALKSGRMVPVENIRKIQSVFVSELGQVFRAVPNMVASHLLPGDRPTHYAAWKKILPALEVTLKKIDAELERLTVC